LPGPKLIPTHTQIERQARGDFERILHEDAQLTVGLFAADQWILTASCERQSQQKIGIAGAAEISVERKIAISAIGNQGDV